MAEIKEATPDQEWVMVPKAALDWLDGKGPDFNGYWFGDEPGLVGLYWWRSKFRAMLAARPVPSTEGWRPIEELPAKTGALVGRWITDFEQPFWVQKEGHWYEWENRREWFGFQASSAFYGLEPTHFLIIDPPHLPSLEAASALTVAQARIEELERIATNVVASKDGLASRLAKAEKERDDAQARIAELEKATGSCHGYDDDRCIFADRLAEVEKERDAARAALRGIQGVLISPTQAHDASRLHTINELVSAALSDHQTGEAK